MFDQRTQDLLEKINIGFQELTRQVFASIIGELSNSEAAALKIPNSLGTAPLGASNIKLESKSSSASLFAVKSQYMSQILSVFFAEAANIKIGNDFIASLKKSRGTSIGSQVIQGQAQSDESNLYCRHSSMILHQRQNTLGFASARHLSVRRNVVYNTMDINSYLRKQEESYQEFLKMLTEARSNPAIQFEAPYIDFCEFKDLQIFSLLQAYWEDLSHNITNFFIHVVRYYNQKQKLVDQIRQYSVLVEYMYNLQQAINILSSSFFNHDSSSFSKITEALSNCMVMVNTLANKIKAISEDTNCISKTFREDIKSIVPIGNDIFDAITLLQTYLSPTFDDRIRVLYEILKTQGSQLFSILAGCKEVTLSEELRKSVCAEIGKPTDEESQVQIQKLSFWEGYFNVQEKTNANNIFSEERLEVALPQFVSLLASNDNKAILEQYYSVGTSRAAVPGGMVIGRGQIGVIFRNAMEKVKNTLQKKIDSAKDLAVSDYLLQSIIIINTAITTVSTGNGWLNSGFEQPIEMKWAWYSMCATTVDSMLNDIERMLKHYPKGIRGSVQSLLEDIRAKMETSFMPSSSEPCPTLPANTF